VSAIAWTQPRAARTSLLRRLASQEALLAIAIIALVIVVGAINPRFLAARNLSDILLGNAYVAVAAIGLAVVCGLPELHNHPECVAIRRN